MNELEKLLNILRAEIANRRNEYNSKERELSRLGAEIRALDMAIGKGETIIEQSKKA